MSVSMNNLFNFSRALPEPFDKLVSKKVKVTSKYGSATEATLSCTMVKAVHAHCNADDGNGGCRLRSHLPYHSANHALLCPVRRDQIYKSRMNTCPAGGISAMSRPETKTSMTSPVRSSVPSKNVMVPRSSENWYSPGKIRKSWSAVRSAFIPSTRVSRFQPMAAIL